eukprot:7328692-Alexandrium_andersonii.AAC.1
MPGCGSGRGSWLGTWKHVWGVRGSSRKGSPPQDTTSQNCRKLPQGAQHRRGVMGTVAAGPRIAA